MWYIIFVMNMKENVKIFLIALILGMAVAFFLSFKFKDQVAFAINPEVTLFYVGSYNNEESAQKKAEKYPNSLVYPDGNIYKVIVGVYHDQDVIELMSSYFHDQGYSFYQEELKVDSSFLNEITNYEYLIKSSEVSYYETINRSLLNLFHEYLSQNS